MNILQLIDTLHPGGAERVALNYANSLLKYGVQSHICATRDKGVLVDEIQEGVSFHFLGKKNTFDLLALIELRNIVRDNKIDIVHAHGTSWFFAMLCKLSGIKFKLIWHDHYGNSEFLSKRNFRILNFFSKKIDGIISVNIKLRDWAKKNLNCPRVIYLNNFITNNFLHCSDNQKLMGNADMNLICIANLRKQKDHETLIKAFNIVRENFDVALHLFGKNFRDTYSKNLVNTFKNTQSVYWYGEKQNIRPYIKYADVGVLSSISEGLPLALLEYADAGIGVVCTDVGECGHVVGEFGRLAQPGNAESIAKHISYYISNREDLKNDSIKLKFRVEQLFSENQVFTEYLSFCQDL